MKKTFFFVMQLLIVVTSLFAEQYKSIDEAILKASKDLMKKCSKKSILVIDDFESPSGKLTLYIRNQFEDSFVGAEIQLVTRKNIDKIENELRFQHNSGKIDENTIISVAKFVGANAVVFGNFEELNDLYMLRLRMLDIKTAKYIFSQTYEFSRDNKTEQLLGRAAVYKKVALGFGAEVNKNSLDSVAPAGSVTFDYSIFRKVSLGVKMFASFDVNEKDNSLTILEPLALLKVYLVSPSGEPGTGVFLEGLGGVSILLVDSDVKVVANCGGGFGYRAAFGNFYIEPEIRVGYPFIAGAGLSAGFRF